MKTPSVAPTDALGPKARRVLDQCARRWYGVRFIGLGVILFLISSGFFGLLALVDVVCPLPASWRLAALSIFWFLLLANGLAYVGLIFSIRPGPLEWARRLEAVSPAFSADLGALLAPAGGLDPSVRQVLLTRTEAAAHGLDVRALFDRPELLRRLHVALAAVLILILSSALLFEGRYFQSLARCLFPYLTPEIGHTRRVVSVEPGDTQLPEGLPLRVQARIRGPEADAVRLEVLRDDTVLDRVRLRRIQHNRWSADVPPRDDDFRYRVVVEQGHDATDRKPLVAGPFDVRVLKQIRAEIKVQYKALPAYTGLRPSVEHAGHVDAPVGTEAVILLKSNLELADVEARWESAGQSSDEGAEPQRETGRQWGLPFKVEQSGTWHLKLSSRDGTTSTLHVPVVARVDNPPEVQVGMAGGDPDTANPAAPLPFVVAARDDYGLSDAALVLLIGSQEHVVPLQGDQPAGQHLFLRPEVDIADLLTDAQAAADELEVAYYAVASDNHQPQPQASRTPMQILRLSRERDDDFGARRRRAPRRLKRRKPPQDQTADSQGRTAGGGDPGQSDRGGPDRLDRSPPKPPSQGEAPPRDQPRSDYAGPPGAAEEPSPKPPRPEPQPQSPPGPQPQGDGGEGRQKTPDRPKEAPEGQGGGTGEADPEGAPGQAPGQKQGPDGNGRKPFGPTPPKPPGGSAGSGRQPGRSPPSPSASQGSGGDAAGAGQGPKRRRHGGNPTGQETGDTGEYPESVLEERVSDLDVTPEEALESGAEAPLLPGGAVDTGFGKAPDDEAESGGGSAAESTDIARAERPPARSDSPDADIAPPPAGVMEQLDPEYRDLVRQYFRRLQERH